MRSAPNGRSVTEGCYGWTSITVAYRIEPREPIPDAIRRIALEELDGAIADLTEGTPDLDHRVHEARKHLKRLRALLELARGCVKASRLEHEKRAVRSAARSLAGVRGEAALVESFEALQARFDGELDTAASARIRERLGSTGQPRPDAAAALGPARVALTEVRARLVELAIEGTGFDALEPGFCKTYERARKAFRWARKHPEADQLHRFRTPEKRHFYQVQLLEPMWPEVLHAQRKELSRLGDWLGDHHDLSLLGPELRDRGLSADDLGAIEPLIWRRSQELEREVFDLGSRLVAESPRALCRRFAAYFEAAAARGS